MRCRQARSLLSDYIEESLAIRQHDALETHLDRCASCRAFLEQMQLNLLCLGNVPEVPVPDNLLRALSALPSKACQDRIHETADGGQTQHQGIEPVWFNRLFSNAAAAALLVIFVAINLTLFNPRFQESWDRIRPEFTRRGSMVLERAADWEEGLSELKRQVLYQLSEGLDDDQANSEQTGPLERETGSPLVEFGRALDLKGT